MITNKAVLRCILCVLAVLVIGCSTIRYTQPARTATEQFLMSYAAIEAINKMDMAPLAKHKVLVDETYFESFDKPFVVSQLRGNILSTGATIADKKEDADTVVEIRSAGLGIDRIDTLLGLPSIPVPIPTVGTISTPELAIFKRIKQTGWAGLSLTAYDQKQGNIICLSGPSMGKSIKSDWYILGIPWTGKKNFPNLKKK